MLPIGAISGGGNATLPMGVASRGEQVMSCVSEHREDQQELDARWRDIRSWVGRHGEPEVSEGDAAYPWECQAQSFR